MDRRVLTVIALMKHDPRRALPLSRLAQSVNLSPTRLCYLFKAETGTPPARYLRTLRMQDATTLLVTTFLSVKEIIARVGFTDESHFVRDFKRIYGVTPTEYRKQMWSSTQVSSTRQGAARIGQGIVRNANEISLREPTQRLIVRDASSSPQPLLRIRSRRIARLANRKRSAGARASLVVNCRRGPVGIGYRF